VGPALFHWESQSTTTAASPTGQRYIHHEARGSRVLLYRCAEACGYVREQRKQDGRPWRPHRTVRVSGVCHLRKPRRRTADGVGESLWRLEREIPAAWLPVMALAV
jgi:hypothetical protein